MKLYKKIILVMAVLIALGLLATVVLASGIKWGQPPVVDPNPPNCFVGWDEQSVYALGPIVADDWQSFSDEPVLDIHWWGSYVGWAEEVPPQPVPYGFHIGMWSDVPVGPNGEFSHPGEMLWEYMATGDEVVETLAGCDFYAPMMNHREACFKYDLILPQEAGFFPVPDTIYWISISARYDIPPDAYRWGWTTRPHYFNDDAVRILDPVAPVPGIMYVDGKPIEEGNGTSWDMAFLLTTEEPQGDLDFGDAPEEPELGLAYPTTIGNMGARHSGYPTQLGIHWDSEFDGRPTIPADGDDILDGSDDEDGVFFTTPLVPGELATVIVGTQGSAENCLLNAWIDYDQSGWWDHPGPEHIIQDVNLSPGFLTPLSFMVPADAKSGKTYARFRCSMRQGLFPWHDPDMPIPDGEVEDYLIEIKHPQWQKLIQINDGPWEPWNPDLLLTVETSNTITIVDTVYFDPPQAFGLWESWSPEHLSLKDYQYTAGTVQVFTDTIEWIVPPVPEPVVLTKTFHVDPCNWRYTVIEERLLPEEGEPEIRPITIVKLQPQLDIESVYDTEVYAGSPATFTLVYSNTGGFENFFTIENGFPLEAPFLSASPPPDEVAPDRSWVRWVFSDGLAMGEMGTIDVVVEISETLPVSTIIEIWDTIFDHMGEPVDTVITVFHVDEPLSILDWGDAPDRGPVAPGYPTLALSDGARHVAIGPFMGTPPDTETDGQPTAAVDGDDVLDGHDDEDGVYLPSYLIPGDPAAPVGVDMSASNMGCYLNAWVDFYADSDWDDPGEQIFADLWLAPGVTHMLSFPVPFDVHGTGIIATRFRCSSEMGLAPTGEAPDGEVEDHPILIEEGVLRDVDFGDAPQIDTQPYPTTLSANGARHKIGGPFMGGPPDPESDGQPTMPADGDDVAGLDDEDGVLFPFPLIPGDGAPVEVDLSASNLGCYLNAWLDFNVDGDWDDVAEQVFTDVWLGPGFTHLLTFTIPTSAALGETYARFRCSTQMGLLPVDSAPDGEVEDYLLVIEAGSTFELAPEEEVVHTPYAQHTYTLTLTNNDTVTDTFVLSYAASDTSALAPCPDPNLCEWQVELSTMTVTVGGGTSVDFTALVLIPALEVKWVTQTLTVTATSLSYGTTQDAILTTSTGGVWDAGDGRWESCRFDFTSTGQVTFLDVLTINGYVGTPTLLYDIGHSGLVTFVDVLRVNASVGVNCNP